MSSNDTRPAKFKTGEIVAQNSGDTVNTDNPADKSSTLASKMALILACGHSCECSLFSFWGQDAQADLWVVAASAFRQQQRAKSATRGSNNIALKNFLYLRNSIRLCILDCLNYTTFIQSTVKDNRKCFGVVLI